MNVSERHFVRLYRGEKTPAVQVCLLLLIFLSTSFHENAFVEDFGPISFSSSLSKLDLTHVIIELIKVTDSPAGIFRFPSNGSLVSMMKLLWSLFIL